MIFSGRIERIVGAKVQEKVKLFGEYGGYAQGAQMRDFVFIDDVATAFVAAITTALVIAVKHKQPEVTLKQGP